MYIARIICGVAYFCLAASALAQVESATPTVGASNPPSTISPPSAVAGSSLETIELAPTLQQQAEIRSSTEMESATSEKPATAKPAQEAPANAHAERTDAMPNAVTLEALPTPASDAPEHKDFSWRYRSYGGRWWYWMPNKSWMIWEGSQWTKYTDYLARHDSQSRGTSFRGNRQATAANGPYYDGPSISGYRGTSPPRYYTEYRPAWRGDESDYGPSGFGPSHEYRPQGHDYWPGWRGSPDFGSYNSPYNSGTFQGGLGAGAGGGIGAAAVAGS